MMNKIVMLFTLQGQIIGELIETLNLEVGIRLKNPVMVINQGTGVSFFPMTQFVEEEEAVIPHDKLLFDGVLTPKVQMQNEYRRMFGSGIEIATAIPKPGIALA